MKRGALTLALATALFAMAVISTASPAHASAVLDAASSPRCTGGVQQSSTAHRAGLVITFGDGRSESFCIAFEGDTISGLEQLERAGLVLVTYGSGDFVAVCSIDGQGSSRPTNCFSSCTGGSCAYWAYYRYVDGVWKFSSTGASQTAVRDGDVFGWSWGSGGAGGVPQAPGEICPVTAPTPLPTATPELPATEPPAPATPRPSATAASELPTSEPDASLPPGEPSAEPAVPLPHARAEAPVASGQPSQSAVEGAALSPATATSTPVATAPAPTGTPKAGAIVIGDRQGSENRAQAESRRDGNGGGPRSLVVFALVAGALVVVAGGITYWRRHAV